MVNISSKLKDLGILIFIAKSIKILGIKLETIIKKYRYSKNKKYFNIQVDDDAFKMSFLNVGIDKPIHERIDGEREPETTSIIKSILRPGNQVLELGGCYGYFTMLMANAVGPNGKVVSIEGLPNTFEILKHNINLNKFKNIEFYNYFIGKKNNKIKFNLTDKSPYEGIKKYNNPSLNYEKKGKSIHVKCINLSDFLDQIGFQPTHIFMDIEGFEIDALEQLSEKYLINNSPTFVFEHHEIFYKYGKGLDYIRQLLTENGYIVRKVCGNIIAFKS